MTIEWTKENATNSSTFTNVKVFYIHDFKQNICGEEVKNFVFSVRSPELNFQDLWITTSVIQEKGISKSVSSLWFNGKKSKLQTAYELVNSGNGSIYVTSNKCAHNNLTYYFEFCINERIEIKFPYSIFIVFAGVAGILSASLVCFGNTFFQDP